ncbi:hypothetical protein ACLMJK_003261 [Lecanora helva]
MSERSITQVKTKDGINWYCEREGNGPHLLLIPSGEGDCEAFTKPMSILAKSFTVTTFDMPGMSRSTAPESAMSDISASKLATQVINLMDELSIDKATIWGCSSGGLVALALGADHPQRIRNLVVHEVPLAAPDFLQFLPKMPDEEIVKNCRENYATGFTENPEQWKALGPAYHERLDRNFVTWARTYVCKVERSFSKEELTRRPVKWTIGAITPAGIFFQNVQDGFAAGIPVGLLPSKHFPQVTIPEIFAEHIKSATDEHL